MGGPMIPAREDLLISMGAALDRTFTYVDATGVKPDLTHWNAMVVCKTYPKALIPILVMLVGSGLTLGADGAISFHLSPEQTAALALPAVMDFGPFPNEGTMTFPGDVNVTGRLGVWELRLFSPDSSDSFTPMSGVVCFRKGPTFGLPA